MTRTSIRVTETSPETALKYTPLFDYHQQLKARMMGFGGWTMPIQYRGITTEHQAVRTQAGMFDISHMGKFVLKGQHLIEQLQSLVPSDLRTLTPGAAKYTVLLNEQAGIIDDLIFYYQGHNSSEQEQGILIVNAATTAKDKNWLLTHLATSQIELEDISTQALIAVQGPKAIATLQTLTTDNLAEIQPFGHHAGQVLGQPAWFARTGYTGEDGFEIMVEPQVSLQLWRSLLDLGVVPCGLGARDTLRLEAAMLLYGQDIDETTTPLEAGLKWLVNLDKSEFIGRAKLLEQQQTGVQRRLVGLQMQGRYIARHGYPVVFEDVPVGLVTSGTLSPTLNRAIALAYVPVHLAQLGQPLAVEIRGKAYPAEVVKRPFYRRPKSLAT